MKLTDILSGRDLGARGAVDGWGLLHALLADVVEDLLARVAGDAAAAAAADSWQLVDALMSEPMRSNAIGAKTLSLQMRLPYVCANAGCVRSVQCISASRMSHDGGTLLSASRCLHHARTMLRCSVVGLWVSVIYYLLL